MDITRFKQEWAELDPKMKWVFGTLVVVGSLVVGVRAMQNVARPPQTTESALAQRGAGGGANDPAFHVRVVPQTPRNQGIETLQAHQDTIDSEVQELKNQFRGLQRDRGDGAATPRSAGPAAEDNVDLSAVVPPAASRAAPAVTRVAPPTLPPPVDFAQPGGTANAPGPVLPAPAISPPTFAPQEDKPPPPKMKVWADDAAPPTADEPQPTGLVIPVNSALEGVMLSGINARPSGSVSGAVGSAISANSVGAPFVTRLKGDAIMPNGWKLGDLGDCFLGGSGVAQLNTERAYVIADNLSCIAANGDVYEAPIKAYGLDVDGTLGLAGKVVSKQGALLAQAALTGMASGLGAALAPTTISAYNTNATNGSTAGVQYPNPGTVAYTAMGQGVNQAAGQLSKFYLDYARETFPVVEVVSGTHITWVLKETIELHRRLEKVAIR